MATRSDFSDSDHDIDRDLDKRLEREGGYTSRRAPTLDERGTVKVSHEKRQRIPLPVVLPAHESDCICDACWGRK